MNYYIPNSHVQIGSILLDSSGSNGNIHQIKISNSVEVFTGTAQIEIPRNLYLKDKKVESLIKEGDPVTIQLGYNGDLYTEFTGFVRRVTSGYPVKVLCENQMYTLKQPLEDTSWRSVTLEELIGYIAPNYQHELVDGTMELGKFTIDKETALEVLQRLKKEFGLFSFFRNEVLHIGYRMSRNYERHIYDFSKNVRAHSLSFKRKEDTKIRIRAISHLKTGKKIKVEVGDKDGALRTLNFIGKTRSELEKLAKQELDNWKFDGLNGTVTGFGLPLVQACDLIELRNSGEGLQDFKGTYTVQSLDIEFGQDGYKRISQLGYKI